MPCLLCGSKKAKGYVCPACLANAASTLGEGIAKVLGPVVERKLGGLLGGFAGFGGETGGTAPPRRDDLKSALEFFGLDETPSEKAVHARYRELARLLHPDHGGSPALMALLNRHKATLLKAAGTS